MFEFHIAETVRKKYRIDQSLFSFSGNVIFPNFRSVRETAARINSIRTSSHSPLKTIRAGELNAMGLLDEIGHFLIRMYDEKENPGVIERAYNFLCRKIGNKKTDNTLKQFISQFPSTGIFNGTQTIEEYFNGSTEGKAHRSIVLEEMIMLYIANLNPANAPFKEFFDDSKLIKKTSYSIILKQLEKFFLQEKPFGPDSQFLFDVLKAPILSHPHSLEAQLGYFKKRWGLLLSTKYFDKILLSFEFSKEEEQFLWNNKHGVGDGAVETFVPEYKRIISEEERLRLAKHSNVRPEDYLYAEHERFTADSEWMPNVVIIAKNTYVWLDQLSKKYQREIRRLDQIPDAELDQLAKWNFTGLWLIGVWERSHASKRIKQLTGNSDAVSSAYSLFDYEIAYDLGGEEAFQNLNYRAWQRGIRLAGDMVPNHMGIFSKWIIEHPEYFIQSECPPYPNYRFTGYNLSEHPDIELRIEDGYWSRSDAAVVFQRIDKRSGEVRYIYHGNDGTNMPWNDTAQLNLLRADVREAIIQNIFHVARKFSIIRFDAAMTLAKKHYQRLWFPLPGTSGVPSRQDHGMSRSEFDAQFPNEFWREVVDRINSEMPNTLLLAEAFWLMEGYFVRTLGMHRVYNSAFMHMLMKEENNKFRNLIKNTLEFNPEILKRYVNFMSNPDEQTAVAQFGTGDKYFGIATMMVTLPGLPMFAHGQIEGFTEKYGMEYQRAYYNEQPNEYLVRRHEAEIFPLMKKRYLFSQVADFESYDFYDERGFVNENVFAYSNKAGEERTIVFFHNKFEETRGRIHLSNPKSIGSEQEGKLRQIHIAGSLQIKNDERIFYLYREHRTNNEYLRNGKELWDEGFNIELRAFEYAVFLDFREVYDAHGEYRELASQLHGRGTTNIQSLLLDLRLRPVHNSILLLFNPELLTAIISSDGTDKDEEAKRFQQQWNAAFQTLSEYTSVHFDTEENENPIKEFFDIKEFLYSYYKTSEDKIGIFSITKPIEYILIVILVFLFLEFIKNKFSRLGNNAILKEVRIENAVRKILAQYHPLSGETENDTKLLFVLLSGNTMFRQKDISLEQKFELLFNDYETADFLNIHQYNSAWYLNKEQCENALSWLWFVSFFKESRELTTMKKNNLLDAQQKILQSLFTMLAESSYQLETFKERLAALSEQNIAVSTKKKSRTVRVQKQSSENSTTIKIGEGKVMKPVKKK
ncbi:MAG: alpha-amylase [Bacteroidetes bacterium]|nr:alpha-amylase [Bacteroidota bacterium]